jgi:hypothetical protein
MLQRTLSVPLSRTLKPLCPRDNHIMTYEEKSVRCKDDSEDGTQTVASYHCEFEGCSVRYTHADGYFTVNGGFRC